MGLVEVSDSTENFDLQSCCCCFRRLDWLSRQKIAKFNRGTVLQLKQPAFTTARCTIATLRIGHWHMNAEYDTVK